MLYIIYHDLDFNSISGLCHFIFIFSENESHSTQIQNEKQNLSLIPKSFVGNETFDGKTVVTSSYTIFLTSSWFRISRTFLGDPNNFLLIRLMWLMD